MDTLPLDLQMHIAAFVARAPTELDIVLMDDGDVPPYDQETVTQRTLGRVLGDRAGVAWVPDGDGDGEFRWEEHFEWHVRRDGDRISVADSEGTFRRVGRVLSGGALYRHGVLSMVARRFACQRTAIGAVLDVPIRLEDGNENSPGISLIVREATTLA